MDYNKMKPRHFFFCCMIFLSVHATDASSQSLIFCESADKYGKAINPADTFDINPEGGMLTVLLKPGHALNTSLINYEIYYFSDSVSLYNNTEQKEVQSNWLFCWIHLFFKDEGKYRVRALDAEKNLLGTAEVFIKADKK